MKEVNLKINTDTQQAQTEMDQLANASDNATTSMMKTSDAAFTIAETMAGSLALATGAIGLFAGENERMQKIAVKSQSAIAIAIGVRQLAEQRENIVLLKNITLTKLNSVATGGLAKIYRTLGIAVNTSSKSFKLLRTALISTGVGAVVVGLGILISKLTSATDKTDDLRKAEEKLRIEREGKTIASIKDSTDWTLKLLLAESDLEKKKIEKERQLVKEKQLLEELIAAQAKAREEFGKGHALELIARQNRGKQIIAVARLEVQIKDLNNAMSKSAEIKDEEIGQDEKIVELTEKEVDLLKFKLENLQKLESAQISGFAFEQNMRTKKLQQIQQELNDEKITADKKLQLKIEQQELIIEQETAYQDEMQRLTDQGLQATADQEAADLQEHDMKMAQLQVEADGQQHKMGVARDVASGLEGLAKEGSAAAKAFALTGIAIDTAMAISSLVKSSEMNAAQASAGAGVAAPVVYTATKLSLWISGIASIMGSIAQARAVLQSGDSGGAAGAGGGGITYTAPYIPESAAQGGVPDTGEGEGGQPVQAYVVTGDVTNAQAVEQELQLQSSL